MSNPNNDVIEIPPHALAVISALLDVDTGQVKSIKIHGLGEHCIFIVSLLVPLPLATHLSIEINRPAVDTTIHFSGDSSNAAQQKTAWVFDCESYYVDDIMELMNLASGLFGVPILMVDGVAETVFHPLAREKNG